MKSLRLNKSINYIIVGLVLAIIGSCKKDVLEVKDPILKDDILKVFKLKQSITIGIFDITTGKPVGLTDSKKVEVLFSGNDASKITSYEDAPITNIFSDKGFLTISSTKSGTSYNPLDVNLLAKLAGYISTSKRIRSFEGGQEVVKVYMEKMPVNKKISVKSAVHANSYPFAYQITSNTLDNISNTFTELRINANSQMRDAFGNPISGSIVSTLFHYDINEEIAKTSFPGGFVGDVIDKDGVKKYGRLTPAGYFKVEMINTIGVKVDSIGAGTFFVSTLPIGFKNPQNSNLAIKGGDLIYIWKYDSNNEMWKYGNTTSIGNDGNIYVQNIYNRPNTFLCFGWFTPIDPCGTPPVITINAPDVTTAEYLDFDIIIKSSGLPFSKQSISVKDKSQITINQAPNEDLEIKVLGNEFSGILTFNGCSGNYLLNLIKNKPSNPVVTISADISGICGKTTIKQSGVVFVYKDDNGSSTNSSTKFIKMIEGKVTIPDLEKGATYTALFYHNGFYHSRTFKVEENKTHYELSGELLKGCN